MNPIMDPFVIMIMIIFEMDDDHYNANKMCDNFRKLMDELSQHIPDSIAQCVDPVTNDKYSSPRHEKKTRYFSLRSRDA